MACLRVGPRFSQRSADRDWRRSGEGRRTYFLKGPGPDSEDSPTPGLPYVAPRSAKWSEVGWSGLEKTDFVTNVTRIRGLLRAYREALKDGETERADRILAEAQRALAGADRAVE